MINPAVNGTLALLNAATTEPKIKRVVITSSFAGKIDPLYLCGQELTNLNRNSYHRT